jgi:predicted RNA-binding Zn-ribbon protein involved in translation (DUF1610 family)
MKASDADIRGRFETSEAQKLFRLLHGTAAAHFKPVLDTGRGAVVYPEVEGATGLDQRRTRELLEFFADSQILVREPAEVYHSCPQCDSKNLVLRLSCPSCKSGSLKLGSAIEHFRCGHTDMEEAFVSGGGFRCPKCGRALKKLGEDYRKVSNEYRCNNCGKMTRLPDQSFLCTNCKTLSPLESVKLETYYTYRFNPEASSIVEKYALDLSIVRSFLQERGFESRTNVVVKGRSGIEHTADMIAWHAAMSSEERPDILVDTAISREPLSTDSVSAFMVKVIDVGAREAALVAVPSVSKQAEKLSAYYGISVRGCSQVSDIPAKVNEILAERLPVLTRRLRGEEVAQQRGASPTSEQDDKTAILLTMIYERQNESQKALRRLLEQIENRDAKLEDLFRKLLENRAAEAR